PWGGPIDCKEPHRWIWGGPPAGVPTPTGTAPKPAKDLAFAPRNEKLAAFVRSEIPELGVKGEGQKVSPVLPNSKAASTTPTSATSVPSGPGEKSTKRGCLGCATTAANADVEGALAMFGLVALVGRRRRR